MIQGLLIVLILLWLVGFIQIPILNSILFSAFSHPFTIHNFLLLIVLIAVITLLPGIFRTIAGVLLFLWLLSLFGFLVFSGLSHILVIIFIIAVIFSFL
jgi:hypothetical protein